MKLLEKYHTASFDVDAQKCFTPLCPTELPVVDGQNIVDELNAQAMYARLRIGSKDSHSPYAVWVTTDPTQIATPLPQGKRTPNADLYWPVHGVPGTKGFELLDGLPNTCDYDYFIWKGMDPELHPYGACYHDLQNKLSTGIIEYLKNNYIQNVIVGGLAADYCVGTTAMQLLDAGFQVIFNKAATRGISEKGTEEMIEKLRAKLPIGAIIVDNADYLSQV